MEINITETVVIMKIGLEGNQNLGIFIFLNKINANYNNTTKTSFIFYLYCFNLFLLTKIW